MTGSDALATAGARSWVEVSAPQADVLGADRRADLAAWVDALIPADEVWPGAAAVGATAYVEAVAEQVPAFRLELLDLLVSAGMGATPFARLDPSARAARMRTLEQGSATTFRRVYELTCEQYYRAPAVVRVVRERTGFDTKLPTVGAAMPPFDPSRLDRVRSLPLRFPERAR